MESAYTLTTPQATEQVTLNNGVRAFTPALDHFHDSLLDGAAPLLANTDAVATGRVMAAAESARTGRTVHLDRIRDQVGSEQFELALVAAHLAEVAAAEGEHRLRDRTNLALDVVLVVDPVCPLGGRLRAFHGDHVFDHAAPG